MNSKKSRGIISRTLKQIRTISEERSIEKEMNRLDDGKNIDKKPKINPWQKAILAFLATIVGVLVISLLVKDEKSEPSPETEIVVVSDYEKIMASQDADELLQYAAELAKDFKATDLISKLEFYRTQIEVASKIESVDEGLIGKKASLMKIMMIDNLRREHHANELGPIPSEFQTALSQAVESKDEDVRLQAMMSRCLHSSFDYVTDESEENLKRLKEHIAIAFHSVGTNWKDKLLDIIFVIDPSRKNKGVDDPFTEKLREHFLSTGDPELAKAAATIQARDFYEKCDFKKIAFDLGLNNQAAVQQATQLVANISKASSPTPRLFRDAILLVETLKRKGHADAATQAASKFIEAAKQRNELDSSLKEIVNDFQLRFQILGKQLEITELTSKASQTGRSTRFYVIGFLDGSVEALEAFQTAKGLYHLNQKGVQIALVTKDLPARSKKNTNQLSLENIKEELTDTTHVLAKDVPQLLKQLPMGTGPYFIVVDDSFKVIANNLDVEKIRNFVQRQLEKP